jgi:hypothetical protein
LPITSRVALAEDEAAGEEEAEGEEEAAGEAAGEELAEGVGQLRVEPIRELKRRASPLTAAVPPIRELVRFKVRLDDVGDGLDDAAGLDEAAGLADGDAEAFAGSPRRKMSKGSVPLSTRVEQPPALEGEGEGEDDLVGDTVCAIDEPKRAAKMRHT